VLNFPHRYEARYHQNGFAGFLVIKTLTLPSRRDAGQLGRLLRGAHPGGLTGGCAFAR
jgi:hypothetical protein